MLIKVLSRPSTGRTVEITTIFWKTHSLYRARIAQRWATSWTIGGSSPGRG